MGDFALIKGWKADKSGNIVFRRSARNLNVPMAKAGKVSIVEVEEIVETGAIPPEDVHLPGVYVQRVVLGKDYVKPIEVCVCVYVGLTRHPPYLVLLLVCVRVRVCVHVFTCVCGSTDYLFLS